LGGTAAVLAGLCYGAAGYLDRPGISGYTITLVSVLMVAVPALFLGGLMGLRTRILLAAQKSLASGAGFVLGCFGAVDGVWASDHHGVVADLSVQTSSGRPVR
jgi:hypothetical protein